MQSKSHHQMATTIIQNPAAGEYIESKTMKNRRFSSIYFIFILNVYKRIVIFDGFCVLIRYYPCVCVCVGTHGGVGKRLDRGSWGMCIICQKDPWCWYVSSFFFGCHCISTVATLHMSESHDPFFFLSLSLYNSITMYKSIIV